MNITIRPTRLEELGQVMPFYERARRFMATNGNANQWINGYPSPDDIRQDIENGSSYVFVNENQELEGCFAFIRGEDPFAAKFFSNIKFTTEEISSLMKALKDARMDEEDLVRKWRDEHRELVESWIPES